MKHTSVTLLLAIALFTVACSCSSEQPVITDSRPPAIYGRVLDSSGNAVADAGVSLIFSYVKGKTDPSVSGITLWNHPATDRINASYSNQIPGHVSVLLLRADTREVVQTVIDAEQEAGAYTFEVLTRFLPNQAYVLRLQTAQDTAEQLVIVNNTELPVYTPFVRTDNDGRFTIYYPSLPIGQTFRQIFENGAAGARLAISDTLQLAIDGPDAVDRIWSLKVDTTAVVDSTLRLP